MVIRHGSDILQDTQDYNKVVCLLSDIQGTKSVNGAIQGRGTNIRVASNAVVSEVRLGTELAPVTINTTTIREFCIPLMGVLSASTLKALPLHAMKNAPLTIEIYFEKLVTATSDVDKAILDATELAKITSFKVKQVEFFGEQLTFSPEVSSVLEKQTGGKYLINTQSVQSFKNNVPEGTTQATQIPVKCSYLKSLLCAYFDNTNADKDVTARDNPFSANGNGYYSFMIGG